MRIHQCVRHHHRCGQHCSERSPPGIRLGNGDYTLNGTEDDLIDVRNILGKSPGDGGVEHGRQFESEQWNFFGGDSTNRFIVTSACWCSDPAA